MKLDYETYRNHPLLSSNRQYSVVAVGSSTSGVDHNIHCLVHHQLGRFLCKHDIQMHRLKNLLTAVKCKAAQLALDEIRPVLHDSFELDMSI